jgi:hypothetical protein
MDNSHHQTAIYTSSLHYALKNISTLYSSHCWNKENVFYVDDQFSGCVKVMVFNANFNNISVILWQSVLLVEETGVHRENH